MMKMADLYGHLLLLCVLFTISSNIGSGEVTEGTVYYNSDGVSFKLGTLDPQGAAWGVYNDTMLSTGWGVLDIKSGYGQSVDDVSKMYAAGYLEGALTSRRIYQHYSNIHAFFASFKNFTEKELDETKPFFVAQDKWMREMIKEKAAGDKLWQHIAYIVAQYDGLVQGYRETAPQNESLDIFAFQLLNGAGDLLDLIDAVNPHKRPDFSKMSHEEIRLYSQRNGHCSALIKVLGAYENMFMSHSSWFSYAAMLRIYKHYDFNIENKDTKSPQLSFSSYPGFLESLDDFYLLSSGMVLLQTTNNVYNMTLYDSVQPHSLLAWQRVRAANMLADNGEEWAQAVSQYNSGTYNNQYMVLDLKRVQLNKTIEDGALTVVEQIPTYIKYADQTSILRDGYWPSYNVPFYETIYDMSGYPDIAAKHGTDYTYQLAPRAKIFRRDEGTVKDMASMKDIMRYNNYLQDPYSDGNPCSTICCRGDLDKSKPAAMGCYDTKVSDYYMAQMRQSYSISGPTLGTNLAPFSWNPKYKLSHIGMANVFDFDFIQMQPRNLP